MAAGYLKLLDWRLRDQEIRSVTPNQHPNSRHDRKLAKRAGMEQ